MTTKSYVCIIFVSQLSGHVLLRMSFYRFDCFFAVSDYGYKFFEIFRKIHDFGCQKVLLVIHVKKIC